MSETSKHSDKTKDKKRYGLKQVISIAAILILLIGLGSLVLNNNSSQENLTTEKPIDGNIRDLNSDKSNQTSDLTELNSKESGQEYQDNINDQSDKSLVKSDLEKTKEPALANNTNPKPKSIFKLKLVEKPDNNIVFENDKTQLESQLNDELKINGYKNSGKPRVKSFTLSIELNKKNAINKIKIYKSNESELDLVIEKMFRSITDWKIIDNEKLAKGEYKIFLH